IYFFYFFFSSRRRHTRSKRDWSSNVCSSDLPDSTFKRIAASRGENHQALIVITGNYTSDKEEETKTQGKDNYTGPSYTEKKVTEIGRASCRERGKNAEVDGGVKRKGADCEAS